MRAKNVHAGQPANQPAGHSRAHTQGQHPAHPPGGELRLELHSAPSGLGQAVLRADIAGMPLEWIDYREAARLYHQEQVAWACGSMLYRLYGGVNAATGRRTVVEVSSIVCTVGHTGNPGNSRHDYVPPLNNETLFRRDAHLCLYCGGRFLARELSRDHVRPFSQGGRDVWTNVVTACRRCNNLKAWRTPEQAKMQLLAVPFTPTYAEYIFLKGRRVMADQMAYLRAHFPRHSPLHERIQRWLS